MHHLKHGKLTLTYWLYFAVVDHIITRCFINVYTVTPIYQERIKRKDIKGSLKITDADCKDYTNILFSSNYPR